MYSMTRCVYKLISLNAGYYVNILGKYKRNIKVV